MAKKVKLSPGDAERALKKRALLKMHENVGKLILEFIADETVSDYIAQKLYRVYQAADGEGLVLLGGHLPIRVKFLAGKKQEQPSFVLPVRGIEAFYVVCDCSSLQCRLMDVSNTVMQEF